MIHHGCEHTRGDHYLNHAMDDDRKMTTALMGYDGRYRCAECKRRVQVDVSDDTYESDLRMLPYVEPPYPDGWCGGEP